MFCGVHLWRVLPLGCLSPPKVYDEVSENADLIGLPVPRPPTNQGGFAPLDSPGLGGRPSLVPPPRGGVLSVAQSADSQTKKEEKRPERHGARKQNPGMENRGFDPRTSRMLNGRSTN